MQRQHLAKIRPWSDVSDAIYLFIRRKVNPLSICILNADIHIIVEKKMPNIETGHISLKKNEK
jgi:hypothetical protein